MTRICKICEHDKACHKLKPKLACRQFEEEDREAIERVTMLLDEYAWSNDRMSDNAKKLKASMLKVWEHLLCKWRWTTRRTQMPKVTLNKPVTVDKKKDKSCSQQRMLGCLRRRYVRTVKIGNKWNTYLQIDHQGFCVVEQTCRHRAQWFGKNLAIALERMLAATRKVSESARENPRRE